MARDHLFGGTVLYLSFFISYFLFQIMYSYVYHSPSSFLQLAARIIPFDFVASLFLSSDVIYTTILRVHVTTEGEVRLDPIESQKPSRPLIACATVKLVR
jgi:hypothetical protein